MKLTLLSTLVLALYLSFSDPSLAGDEDLNVNTATAEQLAAVPGLNADIAEAIVKYREEMGDFMNIDELADVPGMNKELLNKAKQFLRVEAVSGAECNC